MSTWLESLKVGDRVIIAGYFRGDRLAVVNRMTATQIIAGNSRFRRKDGILVGSDSYNRTRLLPPTPERLEKIERRETIESLRRSLEGTAEKLTTDQLRRMAAIAQEAKDE